MHDAQHRLADVHPLVGLSIDLQHLPTERSNDPPTLNAVFGGLHGSVLYVRCHLSNLQVEATATDLQFRTSTIELFATDFGSRYGARLAAIDFDIVVQLGFSQLEGLDRVLNFDIVIGASLRCITFQLGSDFREQSLLVVDLCDECIFLNVIALFRVDLQ